MKNQKPIKITKRQIAVIDEWRKLDAWLTDAKAREMKLRKMIENFFPDVKEGMNRIILEELGLQIEISRKINRKIDLSTIDAVMEQMPEDSPFRQMGYLIDYKPQLVTEGFRQLSESPEHESEYIIFSQCITETLGAPSVDILPLAKAETKPAKTKRKK